MNPLAENKYSYTYFCLFYVLNLEQNIYKVECWLKQILIFSTKHLIFKTLHKRFPFFCVLARKLEKGFQKNQ